MISMLSLNQISKAKGIISSFVQYVPNYNDFINVTSSTDQEHAQNVLNPTPQDHSWGGTGEGEQFLQFEFKESFVYAISYSITSTINEPGHRSHLLGWDFLGSRNGTQWETLNSINDSEELNCNECTKNFECDHKFFKIVQKQLRDINYNGFGIRKFEIYGKLFVDIQLIPIKTCLQNINNIKIYSSMCYIFLFSQ